MPGGREMRTGAEPRPLCGGCPNREARAVRYVEVRLDYRNRHGGEIAASAATLPPVGPDGGEEERRASDTTDVPTTCDPEPDDGMPAAWGPDHPVRLSLKGREPPARRSRNGGVSSVRPEDFGLT